MNLTKNQLVEIEKLITEGYISRRFHPQRPTLAILNYTGKASWKNYWNEYTMMCRGLIVDWDTGRIHARPFKKFFNIEEHNIDELRGMKFTTTDKLDGSLGIMYWLDGKPWIATRGSFDSPQALKATEMLRKRDCSELRFRGFYTVLFEIIYPENKIVVDYGNREDLVILAIVEDESGKDDLGWRGEFKHFTTPKTYRFNTLNELMNNWPEPSNREGYVLKFENGLRVKFKFNEYKSLHKLIYQTTNKSIWERLRDGENFDFLDKQNIPEELRQWILEIKYDLEYDYEKIKTYCDTHLESKAMDRRHLAELYKIAKYPGIMFAMHDGKNYQDLIWKEIRPKDVVTFKQEE